MNIRNKDNEEIKTKIQELQESGVDLSVLTQDAEPLEKDLIESTRKKIQELQESGVDLSVLTQDANSFNQNEKSAGRHM
ncbi:MAG: hypothetical protein E7160_00785 [Firmicutes bacterium]|nr:hypothetical protein [Bacillota bacterium]